MQDGTEGGHGLPTAALDWGESDERRALRSTQFGDVYFTDHDGLAETRHNFIDGNDLPARFAALAIGHPSTAFTIGELGFGTGLNVLAAWAAWEARGHDRGRLHIFSLEGYPLSAADFARAAERLSAQWPELAPYAARLAALYPPLVPGFNTLHLAPDVTLTLALGQAVSILGEARLAGDAWFLDGFSPAQNDTMWSEDVLGALPRLSADGATFATFTVAGDVRRRLEAAGFALEKRPGHGRKREMLTGRLETRPEPKDDPAPWFSHANLAPPPPDDTIAIAGAGIAGASLAWHLRRAGRDVAVYDPAGPAAGASGNPAGLIMPRLDLGNTPARAFYLHAFLYTVRLIETLEAETGEDLFAARGGLILATSAEDNERHERLAAAGLLPGDWLYPVSSDEAVELAGTRLSLAPAATHLYCPRAGVIRPGRLVAALLGDTMVHRGNAPDNVSQLIIANGAAAPSLLGADVPDALSASRGQIDTIDTPPPNCAITFGRYAAPLDGKTVIGATYRDVKDAAGAALDPEVADSRDNLDAVASVLPDMAGRESSAARAALRCVTPDRHPLAGPIPDTAFFRDAYDGLRTGRRGPYPAARWREGLYALSGLGSRGLVTAPIGAAMLCALMSGTPAPLPAPVAMLVHPARFAIRHLKKR